MTGSSSGNGRAIAVSPAAEGASVVCSDIRREAREGGYESDANTSTDELITATGGKSQYVRGRRRQLLVDGEPRQHEQCLKSVDRPGKGRTFPGDRLKVPS